MNRTIVVSDVDGCLTDGGLYYDSRGKVMKRFSAGDHEGLKMLKNNNIEVIFITADKTGLPITKQRLKDMSDSKYIIANETDRMSLISGFLEDHDNVIFFGDGLSDAKVKKEKGCTMFICPAQSRPEVKKYADYVTKTEGGHAAFLDMAIFVCKQICGRHADLNV